MPAIPQAAQAERRYLQAAAAGLRIQRAEGAPPAIEGYGAVFYRAGDPGTEFELFTDNFERIMPGAFDDQLSGDVRSLFNHDSNWVLGRTKSDPQTLQLSVDQVGLRYRVTPPDTQAVRDQVLAPIQRGDVDGSSIMFFPVRTSWVQEYRDGREVWIRQLEKVQLLESGPVTFPAYMGTTAGVRAMGDAGGLQALAADRDAWLAGQRRAGDWDTALVQARLREVELLEDRLRAKR
jgi:HK97 family phage prohead protease